jgi:hypothetical protein
MFLYVYDFAFTVHAVCDKILQKFGRQVKYICIESEEDVDCSHPRLNVQIILDKKIEK